MRKRAGVVAVIVALPLAVLYAACTDGVTPNCADPNIQCGPSLDGSGDAIEAARLPEASPPIDSAPEAAPDAQPDADLDAGDEG